MLYRVFALKVRTYDIFYELSNNKKMNEFSWKLTGAKWNWSRVAYKTNKLLSYLRKAVMLWMCAWAKWPISICHNCNLAPRLDNKTRDATKMGSNHAVQGKRITLKNNVAHIWRHSYIFITSSIVMNTESMNSVRCENVRKIL